MAQFTPCAVTETTAARMLELSRADFRALTASGALPKGREIAPGVMRWDVEQLRRLARGEFAEGMTDVDW